MSRKPLPVGESDFRDLINQNYYYVDKTDFVREVLEKKAKVLLVCRPRRFGKTLNMSTLRYFLTIKDAEENRKLFEGLNIEKTEYMEHQGKYPVIFLSMKSISGNSFSQFMQKLSSELRSLY
ncbi:MAG: AAA family ATPase, partial [Fusobacteriaceae bacterium]